MDFLIADTFTDSLARLTGDEQKAVKMTAFNLQLNQANPGMSFHKLDKAKDKNFWAGRLLDVALARCPDKQPGNVRDNVRQPFLFIIEYRDGTRAAVYTLNGHGLRWWAFAGDIAGRKEPASTHFWFNYTQGKYLGSSSFVHYINEMMVTGKEPYPAERTLLTTGMLSHLMDSNWENGRHTDIGRRLETPYFDMKYKAGREQLYDRGTRPQDIPLIRGF